MYLWQITITSPLVGRIRIPATTESYSLTELECLLQDGGAYGNFTLHRVDMLGEIQATKSCLGLHVPAARGD